MIGICGIGGVGKTTMANEVCRRTREQGFFEEFAMTSVFQGRDLLKIQKELSRMLGLYFVEEETIVLRAQRLHERLSKGRKILVILDDVWQKLSLQEVGIPTNCKGCKVICTSRSKDVLSDMGTREIFDVSVLTETESWKLFQANAGNFDDTNGEKYSIARMIVETCGGLPIAIITLAKALKNKDIGEWNKALRHLYQSTGKKIDGMAEHVYRCIQWSYNILKDGARTLLLLCCLCPEDSNIWVETLVSFKYLQGKGRGSHDLKDEVRTLVGDLISSNLLIAGEDERSVKVHDVVREVCLSIEGLNKLGQNREPSIIPRKLTFYEEAESQAFKQVMVALADDRICTIGIHGMAGAGKRTLLNEVVEKVKEKRFDDVVEKVKEKRFDDVVEKVKEKRFDDVVEKVKEKRFDDVAMIKAEVVSKMQGDLAEMLDLKFDTVTEIKKQLRARLTDGRRTLIIINYGVWNEEIDLEKIGIPVGAEDKCKVVIVWQDPRVCQINECEKIVEVKPLSSEETLVLFRKHAGRFEFDEELVKICEGQPWAIVILREALSTQDENTWSDARDHLLKGPNNVWLDILDLLKGPYSGRSIICAIEFSYRHLSSREAQILLLLICIMGDTTIETVVMRVKKLELFKDVNEGDLLRLKVIALLEDLQTRFLLQVVDGNRVSVHELVRIACL